jgi:hypothetical protein
MQTSKRFADKHVPILKKHLEAAQTAKPQVKAQEKRRAERARVLADSIQNPKSLG